MDLPSNQTPKRASTREALTRNPPKSLALAFCQVFMVFMPIAVPFFGSHGLDMQQILLLQAWFAVVMLTMEVPSGYLADRVGRKHAIVTGTFFSALGFSTLPLVDGFAGLLVFEGLLGLGLSLISGADLALLYDTELALAEGEGGSGPSAVRNLHVAHSASEALAALTCSALMLWSMDAVITLQCVVGWLPFLIALSLVEPPIHRAADVSAETPVPRRVAMREVVVHLLGGDRVLRLTVIALAVWSLTTYYAVWLLQRKRSTIDVIDYVGETSIRSIALRSMRHGSRSSSSMFGSGKRVNTSLR